MEVYGNVAPIPGPSCPVSCFAVGNQRTDRQVWGVCICVTLARGKSAVFLEFRTNLTGFIPCKAAIFVLFHSLSGLEALFEPVAGLPDQLDLPAEYWKQLLTPSLVKELGDCLQKHGEDLMQAGDIKEWKRKHAEPYWAAVEETLKSHFPRVAGREANSTQAMFRNALALVMEERLNAVKGALILPLYTKELRQSVLAWFHLAAPGFYAVGPSAAVMSERLLTERFRLQI